MDFRHKTALASPRLAELPDPPAHQTGWPWTEDSAGLAPSEETWPRVSIVIPTYQSGRFLEEALRSALLQAYPDLEILVLDGGSDDETAQILERYDTWLAFWKSEADGGQSDAINQGFARASGEIVTFLGSDDLYLPGTFLDVARRYREQPHCGAVVGAFQIIDERSRALGAPVSPRIPAPGPQDLTLLDPASWRLHQAATFYTARALDEVGRGVEPALHYTMDRELLFRVARRFPIVLATACYGLFRRHSESKSVASILPMSREMGQLYLDLGEPDEGAEVRRRRRSLARHHWARGHWKLARSGVSQGSGAVALLLVLKFRPDFVYRLNYLATWAEVFGLRRALRWIRRLFIR